MGGRTPQILKGRRSFVKKEEDISLNKKNN